MNYQLINKELKLSFDKFLMCEAVQKYSCVLAPIDNDSLVTWAKKNIKEEDLHVKGIETEPHVTVLYGLHTNNSKEIEKILKDTKPFNLTLGKISKFADNPEFDVLKFEIKSQELFQLNKLLRTLKYTSDFYQYSPHCTIAYIKKGKCVNLLGDSKFKGKTFKIDRLVFSDSEKNKTTINI